VALTGNTVQSTYLDLVQLEKSGAGLPSHAGKEAALYDGSGAQIVGRSAVRHWLDPHPDAAAFAETWEFSTKGTMTQAALETAGWTFVNCTGSVSGGFLTLVSGGSYAVAYAYLTVSLTGDFDILSVAVAPKSYGTTPTQSGDVGGVGVGDTTATIAHHSVQAMNAAYGIIKCYTGGTMAGLGGTKTDVITYGATAGLMRISRVSGTVYCKGGTWDMSYLVDDSTSNNFGWGGRSAEDATTFTRLFLSLGTASVTTGATASFPFIRRFQ